MKTELRKWILAASLLSVFAVVPSAIAQTSSGGGGAQPSGGSASQSSQSTTTTSSRSSEPAQTTTTKTTGVDPLWLILGGVGLIAIIAIIVMASRGRSSSGDTVVHERETVIKK
ncbi:MAG: hypothetical protein ABR577_10535 [Pyrinomonadaceae bacterium]